MASKCPAALEKAPFQRQQRVAVAQRHLDLKIRLVRDAVAEGQRGFGVARAVVADALAVQLELRNAFSQHAGVLGDEWVAGKRNGRHAQKQDRRLHRIPTSMAPMASASMRTTSPGFSFSPRGRPTPAGEPVNIMSPGSMVTARDTPAICSAME